MPTLLLIGEKDNTAIGKDRASDDVKKTPGHYDVLDEDVLGEQAAAAIPEATPVEFSDLGRSPHSQESDRFHDALFEGLSGG